MAAWLRPDDARDLQSAHAVDGIPAALARLGQETRAHHAAADRAWLSLALDGATVDAYRAQLARVYGFEAPLEVAFRETRALRGILDPASRARSHLLARDLAAL